MKWNRINFPFFVVVFIISMSTVWIIGSLISVCYMILAANREICRCLFFSRSASFDCFSSELGIENKHSMNENGTLLSFIEIPKSLSGREWERNKVREKNSSLNERSIIHIPTWFSACFSQESYFITAKWYRIVGIFQPCCQVEWDSKKGRDQYRVIDNYIKSHLNALEIAVRDFFGEKSSTMKNATVTWVQLLLLNHVLLFRRKLLAEIKLWCHLIRKVRENETQSDVYRHMKRGCM